MKITIEALRERTSVIRFKLHAAAVSSSSQILFTAF
jgi:hypothetical protein